MKNKAQIDKLISEIVNNKNKPEINATKIEGTDLLIQIDNIFSKRECNILIKIANLIDEWKNPGTGGSYKRIVFINDTLANELQKRIINYIPKSFTSPKHINRYKIVNYRTTKMNNFFRFSRYNKGGDFPLHCDGQNYDKDGSISFLTLNIFLNDDFQGGETEFYESDNEYMEIRHIVKPKAGRAALFYHDQYHCGNKVRTPYKYLIRTDILGEQY